MGDWNRSTRKITIEQIKPEITAAIQEHIQYHNLGSILKDYLICIETVSTKKKKGIMDLLLGAGKLRLEAVILTSQWLVMTTSGEKPGSTGVLSVQLKDAVVMDHRDHPGYKILPDNGLHVDGVFTGRVGMQGNQRISYFMGLGEELAAQEFKEILSQCVQKTRK